MIECPFNKKGLCREQLCALWIPDRCAFAWLGVLGRLITLSPIGRWLQNAADRDPI